MASQNSLNKVLIDISIRFINLPVNELDSAINSAMAELGGYTGADRFYVFSYDWQKRTASNTHEWCAQGIEPQIQMLQDYPMDNFVSWLRDHEEGKTNSIEDVRALPVDLPLRQILESQSILSTIAVPIMSDKLCLGFVGLDWVRSQKKFTSDEEMLLKIFAEMLANVRNRLMAVEALKNSLAETEASREALRASEEKYRSLINSSDAAIIMYDRNGKVLFLNSIAAAPYGKNPHELEGLNVGELFPPDQTASILKDIRLIIAAGKGEVLETKVDLAGQPRWFRTSIQPVRDPKGEIYAVMMHATDITARKEADIKVVRSEKNYRSLFVESPEAYLIFKDGVFVECNRASEQLIGGSREDIIGKSPASISPAFQPDGQPSEKYVARVVAETWEKGNNSFEFLHQRVDGTPFFAQVNLTVLEYDESPVILVTWRDITERKKSLEELQLYHERYSQALRHSKAVVWETDLDGKFTYMSPVSLVVFGYEPAEIEGKMYFYDFHPADVRDFYRRRGFEIMQAAQPLERLDNPIVRKDGEVIWVSTIGVSLYGKDGQRTGYRCVDFDITERHAAEQQTVMFREVLKQANYGAAINSIDGKFIFINEAFANMHGYTVDELMDKDLRVFHTAEQLPVVEALIKDMMQAGEFSTQEVWHMYRDGSVFPTLMSGVVIKDEKGAPAYISATALDITELKAKEAEIQKLMTAIEQSPVALLITDLEAVIQYISPAFTRITGYSRDEAIGQHTRLLKSGLNPPEMYKELWQTITSGKTWHAEWTNKKKNGEIYPERVSILPINDHRGKVSNYLAIKQDISDRRQAEEARIARQVAERANQMKSIFLANMSHEIRTPLNAVIGFAQILQRDKTLAVKQAQQVSTILRSGEHLLSLINDILDLSKIEAGRITLKESGFSLHGLLEDLRVMFLLRAEEKKLQLRLVMRDSVPEFISADEGKIRQILINLIGNAVKFTEAGTVTIHVSGEPRKNAPPTDARQLELVVGIEDTGPGIPPHEQELIFNAFQQSSTQNQKIGGTGLGLTISRRLAEIMGGVLTVTSQVGQGSTFTLRIPVLASWEIRVKQTPGEFSNVVSLLPGPSPVKILVADDVPENLELVKAMLEPLGFAVRTAVNGREAVEQFLSWQPSAIIMDLRMPVMDGYEATKAIRAHERGANLPIIVITASAFEDDERVRTAGFSAYVRKPFTLSHLLGEFAHHLNLQYQREEEEQHSSSATPDSLATSVQKVPLELRDAICAAVKSGNSVHLRELLGSIKTEDATLAEHTLNLARKFDYDGLLELFR